MKLVELRRQYHRRICEEIIRIIKKSGSSDYPNNADGSNTASREIAWELVKLMGCKPIYGSLSGQTVDNLFELITKDFLEEALGMLQHIRPGKWIYTTIAETSDLEYYRDLARIKRFVKQNRELATTLGPDYVVSPDIIIARKPVSDDEINRTQKLIETSDAAAKLTPIRKSNMDVPKPILHASISCKWTLRSDRAQNTRTEALNLIRNRKGKLPHIVAVTAEPTPIRIASLALGTGDIDCVYHFALDELKAGIENIKNEDQLDMLNMLIEGRRLRDISDLPFDLAT
ncbi:MAG: restriction endonuclease [Candidatus Brocadia sp. WS118]|nr:MAG: restriction endonuclease [Candidatus Brocadia sp. WS118]